MIEKSNWVGILFDSIAKYPSESVVTPPPLAFFIATLTDASGCFEIASLTTPLIVLVWARLLNALIRKIIARHLLLIHSVVHIIHQLFKNKFFLQPVIITY